MRDWCRSPLVRATAPSCDGTSQTRCGLAGIAKTRDRGQHQRASVLRPLLPEHATAPAQPGRFPQRSSLGASAAATSRRNRWRLASSRTLANRLILLTAELPILRGLPSRVTSNWIKVQKSPSGRPRPLWSLPSGSPRTATLLPAPLRSDEPGQQCEPRQVDRSRDPSIALKQCLTESKTAIGPPWHPGRERRALRVPNSPRSRAFESPTTPSLDGRFGHDAQLPAQPPETGGLYAISDVLEPERA